MTVYSLNMLPTTTLAYRAPFEVFFGFFPSNKHLRFFKCFCYPNISLLTSYSACVFLDPYSDHRGYHCLRLTSNTIIISRHVTFVEDYFPYSSSLDVQPPPSFWVAIYLRLFCLPLPFILWLLIQGQVLLNIVKSWTVRLLIRHHIFYGRRLKHYLILIENKLLTSRCRYVLQLLMDACSSSSSCQDR